MKYLFLAALTVAFSAQAEVYTLQNFLQDVEGGHEAVKGAELLAEGGKLREAEAKLVFSPQALGLYQITDDRRETNAPAIMGNRTVTKIYSLGVGQQTSFGLSGKAAYNFNHVIVYNASPAFFPVPNFYLGGPSLELTQSLWRNFLGREVRAQSKLLYGQAKISQHVQNYKRKMLLLEAESTYWRLALARQNILVSEESFGLAKKIRDWAQKRAGLQLGDRGDFLQAQSAVQLRELEIRAGQNELRAAARAFNLARGRDSEEVPEELARLDDKAVTQNMRTLAEVNREDLEAARVEYELAQTGHALSLEQNRPTFEAFWNYSRNGRDQFRDDAISESLHSHYPNTTYGLRLQAPLDYFSLKTARAGHVAEEQGALLNYQRKKVEVEKEWEELGHKKRDAEERLTLLSNMEKTQREKLSFERDKHNRGRTTTYQVLLFEQDYTSTVQNRIRAQAELVGVLAKMNTFGVGGI